MRKSRKLAIAGRIVAPLFGASILLASAGIVAADEPPPYVVLDPISCDIYNDAGDLFDAVPAGNELFIANGWIANTHGQMRSFLNHATWVLTVDGQAVDLTPYLSGPINLGPFWGDFFVYSAGTPEAGATLQTHFDWILKSSNFDGEVHYKKGSVLGGGVDCTVPVSAA